MYLSEKNEQLPISVPGFSLVCSLQHLLSRKKKQLSQCKDEEMQKILIVDDTVTVLMSEKLLLSAHGFDITIAYDGKEALAKIKAETPDLVLCDVIMPTMGGVEFLHALREEEKGQMKHLPVIMVTTQGQNQKMRECFDAGCDDYVTKPIDKHTLLAKIKRHLPKRYAHHYAMAHVS